MRSTQTLTQTKLHIPQITSEHIVCQHLLERLNESFPSSRSGFERKLTLVSDPANLANYLVFILVVPIPFWVLIATYVLFRDRSEALLDRLFVCLKAHSQMVLIVVLVFFGFYFLVKGIQGL